ncbi:uncharacterized protein LOC128301860 isoform X1 [Anopheles moucheti]|uniref:uncharacterized protein LOC128301860 isoform X1 n=1 Tax=Anopheles moucheti TaxID=186751 RepID=UPI0022F01FEF|nr:uncharacterized protein LOC128301860 isoform X1 [Anopheles moucheti]
MGDSTHNRFGTISGGTPAELVEASTTIKQEPLDEDASHSQSKEPSTATFQEASSSNCSSRDPLAEEIEFGETGISFQNAFFNVVGNEIKTENIIADEIEDNSDIVGSSTKRRKTCDEDSGDELGAARSSRQSIVPMSTNKFSHVWLHFIIQGKGAKCRYCGKFISMSNRSTSNLKRHMKTLHPSIPIHRAATMEATSSTSKDEITTLEPGTSKNLKSHPTLYSNIVRNADSAHTAKKPPTPQPSKSSAPMNGQGAENCTYVIEVLNNAPNVATEQTQPKERLKVLTPNILNCNMKAKYSTNTASSSIKQAPVTKHDTPNTKNCAHCACFDKFVTEHNRKVDQFLVKQQKIVNDMFKAHRSIMDKLQQIETNLANQTNRLEVRHEQEQTGELTHSPADANEFVQLPEYAFEMRHIQHQAEPHQHMGEYPEEVQLFSFSRMESEEELIEFEKRLSDSEYFKEAYNWLNSLITETNCGNRMLAALDLLFDKVFVNMCSWTGRGRGNTQKAPIRCRRNLLQLFKVIGSTRKAIVSRTDVEVFFIKKLKQSKQRLNMQGFRKPTCHIKRVHIVE